MKKSLFQISMLVITFWLIWISSSTQVLGTDSYGAQKDTLTASSEWRLLVDGGVQRPINLTFDELVAMPRSTISAELVCPGFFTINGNWTGVTLRLVLEKAGFDPNAATVEFLAQDGYQVSLSIREAMRDDVIIAYEKDGEPLPEATRLVIPGTIGGLWIRYITQIKNDAIQIPEFSGLAMLLFVTAVLPTALAVSFYKRKHIT
jgi:DMSO/TMAO reductase YedYZ molybdopterin-dependent catalytic subunit